MQMQSKPFQVISGNRTQVGACNIYFVLLFKPNCQSLLSCVAGVMGASSRGPAEAKWKTSQWKQESGARHVHPAASGSGEELTSLLFAQG